MERLVGTAYKTGLGYVPEEPHLYSYMTGPEYLTLVGRLRGIADAVLESKIERFLKLLGSYDDRYQTLASHSKGMRQKVLIAAAVLHDPRVIVLDEPFSGLDVTAARMLKTFVRALADDGKIIVFSSHVLEVVEQVCSHVVILKKGRVAYDRLVDSACGRLLAGDRAAGLDVPPERASRELNIRGQRAGTLPFVPRRDSCGVRRDRQHCKFWLAPVDLAWNHGFSPRELNEVRHMVLEYEQIIIEAWNEHCRQR